MKNLVIFFLWFLSGSLDAAIQLAMPVQNDTVLIRAVRAGNLKLVKTLLKKEKVAVNEFGIDQKTALDVAVEYGNMKIAILLAKYDGKMTREDNAAEFTKLLNKRFIFLSVIFDFLFNISIMPICLSGFLLLPIAICWEQALIIDKIAMVSMLIAGITIACTPLIVTALTFKKVKRFYYSSEQNWMLDGLVDYVPLDNSAKDTIELETSVSYYP